ncbi:hypothetical protein BIU82_13825 [Arthrobacter sp. SW1]|uniref:class F sortase n=1 Tax=Arthrobacter sp. SW1 TaxID=1920889 RepID=UPI000877E79D|nr:class F sortase [Arthrobacter sp. SW1]OFI39406.1 hypothetical protein BIU82_13825 [Arthrobacter sp. SW1]
MDTWLTNRGFRQQAGGAIASATGVPADVSEAPVSEQQKQAYVVAADKPRILKIPSLGVEARILHVGITSNGNIDTPKNIDDTAWYNGSDLPGITGVSFIDAHYGGTSRSGVFSRLARLKPYDEVQLERGDGTTLRYTVTKVVEQDAAQIDMRRLLAAPGPHGEYLILMTCAGAWEKNSQTYSRRTIVVADRTS